MNTTVIINPVSAGGKTRTLVPSLLEEIDHCIGGHYTLAVTERPWDACATARTAASDGCDVILAVGGDGTIHEVINGMYDEASGRFPSKLGVISSGSGQGFAQSFGLPRSLEEQVHIALNGHCRDIDLARITYTTPDGSKAHRWFINECQIGLGAEVVRRVGPHQKRKGGLLAYALGTISVALSYPRQRVEITLDDRKTIQHDILGLSIGNGDRTGGGMRLTPDAILTDGQLDVLVIEYQSIARRLRNFPVIYSGDHIHRAGFFYDRTRTIAVSSADMVPVAADGEILGVLPCTIELLPAAIRVQSPYTVEEVRHD